MVVARPIPKSGSAVLAERRLMESTRNLCVANVVTCMIVVL